MKLKKGSITKRIFITIITAIIFTATILLQVPSFAADTTPTSSPQTLYLKLSEFMTQDTPHMGYAIGGDPNANGGVGHNNAHHIWNIIQTTEQEVGAKVFLRQRRNSAIELLNVLRSNNIAIASAAATNQNIYCVNAEVGFNEVSKTAKYDASYDMINEKDDIKAKSNILRALVEDTIPEGEGKSTNISKYNALLALLDMLYLNDGEDKEADKKEFLDIAGIHWSDVFGYYYCSDGSDTYNCQKLLTNDDIKAVQQAAIWYFTNYYETSAQPSTTQKHYDKYDKTKNTPLLFYKLQDSSNSYTSLSDYHTSYSDEGKDREHEAEVLYKYLIKTAKENAKNYSNIETLPKSDEDNAPVRLKTETLKYKAHEDNYIIGPIKLENNESNNSLYKLSMTVTNGSASIDSSKYEILNESEQKIEDNKDVKDLVGNNFYISIPKTSANGTIKVEFEIKYNSKKMTLWTSESDDQAQPVVIPENEEHTVTKSLQVQPKEFDLALRKYITKAGEIELSTNDNKREPDIDITKLNDKSATTAEYKHRKDPVTVKTGDEVTYKITIYNEGEKKGKATKVVDQLPTGLEFKGLTDNSNEYTAQYDNTTNRVTFNLTNGKGELNAYLGSNDLSSITITFICQVTATAGATDKVFTNVAWISEAYDSESQITITNTKGQDRDSEPGTLPKVNNDKTLTRSNLVSTNSNNYKGDPSNNDVSENKEYYWKGQQDDDDFEKLILKKAEGVYDLKLIKVDADDKEQKLSGAKFSITINDEEKQEEITNEDGEITITGINIKEAGTDTITIEETETPDEYTQLIGKLTLTVTKENKEGTYKVTSVSITGEGVADDAVKIEDGVVEVTVPNKKIEGNYKLQIVKVDSEDNAKKLSGAEFKVTLPEGVTQEREQTIVTNEKGIIEIPDIEITNINKSDIIIIQETKEPEGYKKLIDTIEVEVTKKLEGDKYQATDVRLVDGDKELSNVSVENGIIKVEVKNKPLYFDLALRKFIVAVSRDEQIEDDEYLKNEDETYMREPKVDTSKLNTLDENGEVITTATYNHTKEPVLVQKNDIVVYMLRVYNEGEIDGYAGEIKEHLPPYLEFVEGEYNTKYGWTVSDNGRTVTTTYLRDKLIEKVSENEKGEKILDYEEIPIMCKVKDTSPTDEKITNIADITKYEDNKHEPATDRDSEEDNVKLPKDEDLPSYKDDETGEYIPGQEDDDDFEKVIIKEFDLALRKWVTQAIVIENGQTTVTNTGHDAWDDPEQVVKVELNRKKINQVTVKFRYSIRVYNQGDIAGYAKEVTDYVPQGLKFLAEDNPGWTDEGNNVISTRLLENTLLQPGEYADVEVVLTWINSQDNMGVMTNTAEISEDYNEYGVPDKDSEPDNKKPREDDIDDAPVMLSISTGQIRIYFTLGFTVLITIAGGVLLIKEFVI